MGVRNSFSPFESNTRAVAILFINTFDFKINRSGQRRKLVHLETMKKCIITINIYGPNIYSTEFCGNIKKRMKQYNDTFL